MEHIKLNQAVFSISLDFEYMWGSFDKGKHHVYYNILKSKGLDPYEHSRKVVRGILRVFEEHDISATWATVGHLFLEEAEKKDGRRFPDHPHFQSTLHKGDWYSEISGDNFREAPLWYAPDMVEAILAATPPQDLGCHTFSHIDFSHNNCDEKLARAELAKCLAEAEKRGTKLRSFVFPRNLHGHLPLLAEYGFRVTRDYPNRWYNGLKGPLKKVAHVADDYFAISPSVATHVQLKEEILITPSSMFYQSRDGFRSSIPISARVKKAKKGVDLAIRKNAAFQMYFHPVNFFVDTEALLEGLGKILKYVNEKRKNGELQVWTMADYATKLNF